MSEVEHTGFRTIFREPQPCYCIPPRTGYNKGDIIQCITCDQYWKCEGMAKQGEFILAWKKLDERPMILNIGKR